MFQRRFFFLIFFNVFLVCKSIFGSGSNRCSCKIFLVNIISLVFKCFLWFCLMLSTSCEFFCLFFVTAAWAASFYALQRLAPLPGPCRTAVGTASEDATTCRERQRISFFFSASVKSFHPFSCFHQLGLRSQLFEKRRLDVLHVRPKTQWQGKADQQLQHLHPHLESRKRAAASDRRSRIAAHPRLLSAAILLGPFRHSIQTLGVGTSPNPQGGFLRTSTKRSVPTRTTPLLRL